MRIDDVEQARQVFRQLHQDAKLEPVDTLRFGYEVTTDRVGLVHLYRGRWPGGVRLTTTPTDRFNLLEPTRAGMIVTNRGQELRVGVGRLALISPGAPAQNVFGEGMELNNFGFSLTDMKRQFLAICGEEVADLVFRTELDPRAPGAERVCALLGLVRSSRCDGHPALQSVLSDALLTAMLTDLPHSASPILDARARGPAPVHVRRAEEWLDAHLAEPVTLPELALAIGVSARTLQKGFADFRGTTPMEFLRERRLERARAMLRKGEQPVSVVARACGFAHLGRFSADYGARFGEKPSETLESRRVRVGE